MTLFNAARRLIRPAVRHVAKGAQSTLAHDTRRAARRATQSKLFRKAGQTRRAVVAASVAGVAGAGYVSHKANQMVKASNELTQRQKADLCLSHGAESLELGLFAPSKNKTAGFTRHVVQGVTSGITGNVQTIRHNQGLAEGMKKNSRGLKKLAHYGAAAIGSTNTLGIGGVAALHQIRKNNAKGMYGAPRVAGTPKIAASHDLELSSKFGVEHFKHQFERLKEGATGAASHFTTRMKRLDKQRKLTAKTPFGNGVRRAGQFASRNKQFFGRAALGGTAVGVVAGLALRGKHKNIAASYDLELSAGAISKTGVKVAAGLKHRGVKEYLKMRFAKAMPAAQRIANRGIHAAVSAGSFIADNPRALPIAAVGAIGAAHAFKHFRGRAAQKVQKSTELATSHELTQRQKADLCLGFDCETIEAGLATVAAMGVGGGAAVHVMRKHRQKKYDGMMKTAGVLHAVDSLQKKNPGVKIRVNPNSLKY